MDRQLQEPFDPILETRESSPRSRRSSMRRLLRTRVNPARCARRSLRYLRRLPATRLGREPFPESRLRVLMRNDTLGVSSFQPSLHLFEDEQVVLDVLQAAVVAQCAEHRCNFCLCRVHEFPRIGVQMKCYHRRSDSGPPPPDIRGDWRLARGNMSGESNDSAQRAAFEIARPYLLDRDRP